jgi:heme exporter protein B
MFARVAWLILRKDLTVEVRSREIAYTTLFFAVSCVLVFAFALVQEGKGPEDGAAGILWIAIMFAGNLALGRAFERERQAETLRALLLAPAPRPAVYLGKLLGIVALMVAAELVLVPLVAFLFQAGLLAHPFWLAAIVLAGTLGFTAVGTLFALDVAIVRFWLALLLTFDVVFVTLALWTFEPVMTD